MKDYEKCGSMGMQGSGVDKMGSKVQGKGLRPWTTIVFLNTYSPLCWTLHCSKLGKGEAPTNRLLAILSP